MKVRNTGWKRSDEDVKKVRAMETYTAICTVCLNISLVASLKQARTYTGAQIARKASPVQVCLNGGSRSQYLYAPYIKIGSKLIIGHKYQKQMMVVRAQPQQNLCAVRATRAPSMS